MLLRQQPLSLIQISDDDNKFFDQLFFLSFLITNIKRISSPNKSCYTCLLAVYWYFFHIWVGWKPDFLDLDSGWYAFIMRFHFISFLSMCSPPRRLNSFIRWLIIRKAFSEIQTNEEEKNSMIKIELLYYSPNNRISCVFR